MAPVHPPDAPGTVAADRQALTLAGAGAPTVQGRRTADGWSWAWAGARASLRPDSTGRILLELDTGTSTEQEATAGLRAVLDQQFSSDDTEMIGWQAPVEDLATRRIVWSCGFSIDGNWRGRQRPDGSGDLVVGSLLAGEPLRPAHPWWEPAVLIGDRVRLRPWQVDDEPDGTADPATDRFAPGMGPGPDTHRAWWHAQRDRMARGGAVYWCVADPESDRPLGGIQLTELDSRRTAGSGWLGYFLYPKARGRGLLADAIDLLVPHAFADRSDNSGESGIGLHRLTAGTDIGNRASQRVLRRSGFRKVAVERAVLARSDGPPTGALTFELLATDDMVAQTVEPSEVPVLTTDRLRIRPWSPDDAPSSSSSPDSAASRFLPISAIPTAATFESWLQQVNMTIDRGDAVTWCIADAAADRPLGSIAVFAIDSGAPGNAELGYWMYPTARGQGYLTEALPTVLGFALTESGRGGLGLHRLHAVTDVQNEPSRRALERAGFACWGRDHRSLARRDGSLADLSHYELLAPVSDRRVVSPLAKPPIVAGHAGVRNGSMEEQNGDRPGWVELW